MITDDDALVLMDSVDVETDASRKAQILGLLGTYKAEKEKQGLKPFQPSPEAQQEKTQKLDSIYEAGVDGMDALLPPTAKVNMEQLLSVSANPRDAKARMFNAEVVKQSFNVAPEVMEKNWPAYRKEYAKTVLGIDKAEVSETELFSGIAKHRKESAEERVMIADVMNKIQTKAGEGVDLFETVWSQAASGISGKPGWKPANHDKYREMARKVYDAVSQDTEGVRPAIRAGQFYFNQKANQGKDAENYREEFVSMLEALPRDEQEMVLFFASEGAKATAPGLTGEEGSASGVEKAAVSLGRGISGMGEALKGFVKSNAVTAMEMVGRTKIAAGQGRQSDFSAVQSLEGDRERMRIERRVDEAFRGNVDPVASKNRVVQGIYSAVESLPYMGVAAIPYVGIPLTAAAMAEDTRAKLEDNGVAPESAMMIGAASGVVMAGIERLQANMVFKGKLPGLEKWLAAPVLGRAQLIQKMLATGGIETVQQNVEEAAQDITPVVGQFIGSMLTDGVPAVEWEKELKQFGEGRVDTFFAMLPLVLVGTGSATFKDAAYGRQYLQDRRALTALGLNEEQVEAIQTAPTIEAKEAVFQEEFKRRAINSEMQLAAFESMDSEMQALAQEQEAMKKSGARAERQEDGSWAVLDSEGEVVDVTNSPEIAVELVREVNLGETVEQEQVIGELVEFFNERAEEGSTVERVNEARSLADRVEEGAITPEEAQKAVDVANALGEFDKPLTVETARIHGENVAKYDARTGLFTDISKIYDGANPLTVVEERAEGYLKRRIAEGNVGLKDVAQWREEVDGPNADMSERALTEWFSRTAKAFMVGNVDSKAVPAVFRAFLTALRAHFAQVLQIAKKLKGLENEGKMSPRLRTELARAVGLDDAFVASQQRAQERTEAAERGESLSEWIKGKLPSPKDAAARGDPLAGDLKALADGMKNKQTAAAFFAKSGKGMDLDRVAEMAREAGFEVETPGDLLAMVADSMKGIDTFADGGAETFNLYGRIDERTGLPINADGTVTVYHHTNAKSAARIRSSGLLESAGEPDVYVTTRRETDTGYGNTAVAIDVSPDSLQLDDEFPDGRKDFRISVVKPGGALKVKVGANSTFSLGAAKDSAAVVAKYPEVFASFPEGQIPVEIETANGLIPAVVNGYWDLTTLGRGFVPSIGYKTEFGWSHGLLRDGDKVVTPIPEPGDWPSRTFSLGSDELERLMKERRVTQRIATDDLSFGESFSDDLRASVDGIQYEVYGDDAAVADAQKILTDQGLDGALVSFMSDVETQPTKTSVVLGSALVRSLDKAGRTKDAQIVAQKLAEVGTQAGQTVQAFSLLGLTLDTPTKALVAVARETANKVNALKEVFPAIEKAKESIEELVNGKAFELLKEWIDEISGFTGKRRANREMPRVEDLPEITFSLSPEIKASGIVSVVTRMLRESGAVATEKALIEKYGEKVKPHLKDIFIESAKTLAKPKRAPKKKKQERQPKEQQAERPTVQPGTATPPTEVAVEPEFDALEPYFQRLEDAVLKALKRANVSTPRPIRQAVATVMRSAELNEETWLKQFRTAFAQKFDVHTMTTAQTKRLGELAENIKSTPENSIARFNAVVEMNSFIADFIQPYDWIDVGFSLWYSSALAGFPTTIRNIVGNGLFMLGNTGTRMLFSSPSQWIRQWAQIAPAIKAGAQTASAEAREEWKSGQGVRVGEIEGLGDGVKGRRSVLDSKKMVGPWRLSKYVGRFLSMQDMFFANTAYELKSRQIAVEMAMDAFEAGKITEDQIGAEIERTVNAGSDQIRGLDLRASNEWHELTPELQSRQPKEEWVNRRVQDLRVRERNEELVERATSAAQRATFNYMPEGILGAALSTADGLFSQLAKVSESAATPGARQIGRFVAKYGKTQFLPFMRVPVNVFNQAMDYSPAGFARAALNKSLGIVTTQGGRLAVRSASAEEVADIKHKAILGTVALATLWAYARPTPDDEEDAPWIQIHGSGSGSQQRDLAQNGPRWKPWTIEVRLNGSKVFIDYRLAPISPGLAAIGFLHDKERYDKQGDAPAVGFALAQGVASVMLAQAPMQGLSDLAQTASKDEIRQEGSVRRLLARSVTGTAANMAIPLANFWRAVNRSLVMDEKKQTDTVAAAMLAQVPFADNFNRPKLDALGDSMESRPLDWFYQAYEQGTPEARIYAMFGEKKIQPSDLYPYRHRMEPEQFYEFTKARGQFLKDRLLEKDEKLLSDFGGLDQESAAKVMRRLNIRATRYAKGVVGYTGKDLDPE